MILNLEEQKKRFENHIASFTDYGKIKILDFKAPNTSDYRIRFLFEEDYCGLHISGDLGELIATNYNNMSFYGFKDFINNAGYFVEKINTSSRKIYVYDPDKARNDIKEFLKENGLCEAVAEDRYDFETEEEKIEEFIDDCMIDFTEERGIGYIGYEKLSSWDPDAFEDIAYFGEEKTGIVELYMLAFKMAIKQLEDKGELKYDG